MKHRITSRTERIKKLWMPLSDGWRDQLIRPNSPEWTWQRLKWIEKEKDCGIYNKRIRRVVYGVGRTGRTIISHSSNPLGLGFGQWIGAAIDLSNSSIVVILRELTVKMKTLATEQKVHTFPRDFLTQVYDGFEFLGKVGTEAVLLLAQCGCGDEENQSAKDLVQFVKAWEELYCKNRLSAGEAALPPTLEEAAQKAGITYARLSGALAESAMLYGSNMVRVILHTSMPRVVKAILEDAVDPETRTVKDKELAAKVGGLIESGAKVQINNNQLVQNGGAESRLPAYVNAQELLANPPSPQQLPMAEQKQLPEGVEFVDAEIIESTKETENVRTI